MTLQELKELIKKFRWPFRFGKLEVQVGDGNTLEVRVTEFVRH